MQNMWISIVLIVLVIVVGLIAGARLSAPGPQRRAVYFAFGTLAVLAIWFFLFVTFFPSEWIVPFFTVACIVIPICIYMGVARGGQKTKAKSSSSKSSGKSFEIPRKTVTPEKAVSAKQTTATKQAPKSTPADVSSTKTAAQTSAPQKTAQSALKDQKAAAPKAVPKKETAPKETAASKPVRPQQESKPSVQSTPQSKPEAKPAPKPEPQTTPAEKEQHDIKKVEKPADKLEAPKPAVSEAVDSQIVPAADMDILVNKAVAEELDDLGELVRPFEDTTVESLPADQDLDLNVGAPVDTPSEPEQEPESSTAPAPSVTPTATAIPAPTSEVVSMPTAAAPEAPAPASAVAPETAATTQTTTAPAAPAAQPAKPEPKPKPEPEPEPIPVDPFTEFSNRAAALRDQGAYAIAAMLYEEAASLAPTVTDTRNTQFDELACYVKAGDAQKAKALAAKLRQSSVLTRFERIKLDAVERMS